MLPRPWGVGSYRDRQQGAHFIATDPLAEVQGGYTVRNNPTRDDYAEPSAGRYAMSLTVWPWQESPTSRQTRVCVLDEERAVEHPRIRLQPVQQQVHRWHDRMGEITDLSVIAEPDRLRRLAARSTCSHPPDSPSPRHWQRGRSHGAGPEHGLHHPRDDHSPTEPSGEQNGYNPARPHEHRPLASPQLCKSWPQLLHCGSTPALR